MKIRGYPASFDMIDRGGDIIRPIAFDRTLTRGMPALLWQHEASRPIGRVEALRTDARGLFMEAHVSNAQAQALIREGIQGLSFGYRVRQANGTNPRELLDLDLVEISIVTFPMQYHTLLEVLQ